MCRGPRGVFQRQWRAGGVRLQLGLPLQVHGAGEAGLGGDAHQHRRPGGLPDGILIKSRLRHARHLEHGTI